jgi:AI-2 transport protein TqsA
MELTEEGPQMTSSSRVPRPWRDLDLLVAVAAALFIAVGSWYLLKELAPLLRPLVLAVFLAYRIVPAHQALRQRVDARFAWPLLALLVSMALLGLALLIYTNLVDLNAELPQLVERGTRLIERLQTWGRAHLPRWAFDAVPDTTRAEAETTARLKAMMAYLVNTASNFLAEAVLVGLYLVFLLFEFPRLPARIRSGFPAEQADRVLEMVATINRAISSYIRAKALASFVTALPIVVVLWAFGVSFPGMWGVLAFIGNFIPYVGSLVALVFPIILAFLELEPLWRPFSVLALLVLSQFVINNFIEPRLTARAVDLSPLVVLVALMFWGLCWGVVGMVLAIPLTVVLKIVWETLPLTRPLARLMAGE